MLQHITHTFWCIDTLTLYSLPLPLSSLSLPSNSLPFPPLSLSLSFSRFLSTSGRPPQPANPIFEPEKCKAYILYSIKEAFSSCRYICNLNCLCARVYVCVCVSACVLLTTSMSCVSMSLSVRVSVIISLCLCLCLSVSVSVYVFVCMWVERKREREIHKCTLTCLYLLLHPPSLAPFLSSSLPLHSSPSSFPPSSSLPPFLPPSERRACACAASSVS